MNDHIRSLLMKAQGIATSAAMAGHSAQDAILYAANDEIIELEREKERVLAETETLRAKIKELEQRNTARTKLNLFRNIKFLNINKQISNEKD